MNKSNVTLTHEFLLKILSYDQTTGLFAWRVTRGSNAKKGTTAGTVTKKGYVRIQIGPRLYYANCLAWFYMTGAWPEHQVDHVNRLKHDNSFNNLRDVPQYGNQQNRVLARRDNASGLLGATRNGKGWQAQIRVNKKIFRLGTYPTAEQAHQVYLDAKRAYHLFGPLQSL